MSDKDGKSSFLKDCVIIYAVLWVLERTLGGMLRGLLGQTADVAASRKWWMYPTVAVLWLAIAPVLLVIVGLFAMVTGYFMDLALFFAIDQFVAGSVEGAGACLVGYLFVLLVVLGFSYEQARNNFPSLSSRGHFIMAVVVDGILAIFGTIPYIVSAAANGFPVIQL